MSGRDKVSVGFSRSSGLCHCTGIGKVVGGRGGAWLENTVLSDHSHCSEGGVREKERASPSHSYSPVYCSPHASIYAERGSGKRKWNEPGSRNRKRQKQYAKFRGKVGMAWILDTGGGGGGGGWLSVLSPRYNIQETKGRFPLPLPPSPPPRHLPFSIQ